MGSCTKAECQRDEDCPETKACSEYFCIDPCRTVGCQKDFFCKVIKHIPTCGKKYVPEPQEPRDTFVIGESYNRGKPTGQTQGRKASSNVFVIGSRHGGASGRPSSTSSRKHTSGAPRSTVIGASGRYKRYSFYFCQSLLEFKTEK